MAYHARLFALGMASARWRQYFTRPAHSRFRAHFWPSRNYFWLRRLYRRNGSLSLDEFFMTCCSFAAFSRSAARHFAAIYFGSAPCKKARDDGQMTASHWPPRLVMMLFGKPQCHHHYSAQAFILPRSRHYFTLAHYSPLLFGAHIPHITRPASAFSRLDILVVS